jgi:hypothetical protein
MASTNDLDLDINNYNLYDIERFFRFREGQKYTAADIEQREYEIREQLLSSGHIDKRFKRDLIAFLTTAKDWLIYVKCPAVKAPSSIQISAQLDKSNYPRAVELSGARDVDLVKHTNSSYMNSLPSEFFAGSLNPLSTRILTKCITVDTRFRDDFYKTESSDFMMQLPTKLTKVVSMQLASIELPLSFYGISQSYGNSYFFITVNYTDNLEGIIYENTNRALIPDGNYDADTLINVINAMISTMPSPFKYVELSFDMYITGKSTFYLTPVNPADNISINWFGLDFSLDITGNPMAGNISTKMGWNLGFICPKYDKATKYVSDTTVEASSIRYIYLAIEDYNNSLNNHFVTVFNKSILNPNILARISLKGNYFSVMKENDFNIVSEPRRYFGPVDIQKMRIRVYDEHGRILNMNNSNFSFCLNMKVVYDL